MNVNKLTATLLLATGIFTSCVENNNPVNPINPDPEVSDKYILITTTETSADKPGYATAFSEFPSGEIVNNATGSLQGLGFGGWRPHDNRLFKMFNTTAAELGIEELVVDAEGKISPAGFIKTEQTTSGSGNFVIASETQGFYFDGANPLDIQTFDPATMARTGEIKLEDAINERGVDDQAILYKSIGQKFLAVKNGKLYANITYAKTDGAQKGIWDDYFQDVYIAVIDIETLQYEKTIKIEDTGSIAHINDNNMYDTDDNGDLYIVTQGKTSTGGKSKIVRIKADENDIDPEWSLNMDDIFSGGKFVSVFAKGGKIITVVPNAILTEGPNGNLDSEDVWDFYQFDIASKEKTQITGVPSIKNPGAAFSVIEIDDKILLRVNTKDGLTNGYYGLDGIAATPLFNVTAGGTVSGFYKVNAG
ncbi:hypothetical protein HP439_03560 [Sphingobacterium shayense]|uniref:hypothetical protein n=1 Tax=Sphingobacterium shayense TaxID=626343 RepID=UPI001556CECB|nr:hypothetical protein [Sphingobacterium shayense]NQD69798.1 hypothetical protein [Sphingobacterium shayense]